MKFYMAGPFDRMDRCKEIALEIERQTGGEWSCNARWLSGAYDDTMLVEAATDDLDDTRDADALVLLHGKSTTGGMWVEVGYAIARGTPIVVLVPSLLTPDPAPELPVFMRLPPSHARITICSTSSRFAAWSELPRMAAKVLTALDVTGYERHEENGR